MITATVTFDLSGADWPDANNDRRTLWQLEQVPDGARVRILIGSRAWPSADAARLLHSHADRLVIDLEGDHAAGIRVWMDAARTGNVGVPS